MMKRNHTRLCASAAIAAALALSSTPLLAQGLDTTTTVVPPPAPVPETAPPETAQQPTIVAPAEPAKITPPPSAVTAPSTTPTKTTITTTRTERPAAPATPARTTRAATVTPSPAAELADPTPVAADTAAETAAEPAASVASTAPAVNSQPASDGNSNLFTVALIAGALAVLLAIWGFIAIGRRRPVNRRAAAVVERPKVHHPAPIHAEPMPATTRFAAPVTPTPIRSTAPAASLAHSGAAVALPRTMPESFEERAALMERMVAARPDRANPFRSPIQRRHRAKLILQSLDRTFDVEPWIDLSQYSQNWPELARRSQAA